MTRRRTTYNRTNKNTETPSARKARREARANGRGANQAFTSGARSVMVSNDTAAAMRERWDTNRVGISRASNGRFQRDNGNVATYTSSSNGRMSTNGRTAGGMTWAMTAKDENGNTIRQSGRSQMATRRQRYYDIRKGLGLAGG